MSHGNHYHPPDHGKPASEHDVIKGVILDLFGRHHRALAEYIAALVTELHAKIDRQFVELNDKIDRNQQENRTMSGSLSDQLTAALAAITADVDVVSSEVTALLGQLQVGSPVTQAMVDSATSIDQRLKAIPPAPTP